ncbi:hypothetical protein PWEIH_04918 [Listeria weihenstephanensis FSL R9-0317]|uniref:Uncharacterized protein n=1 Tax=Listeria weihenstephanensis TaxID=1006155 RepID=A0A1S7FX01_9LIST|nr:hypothetical protein UE46_13665 [Listeria weihenstephanensis]EUJ40247.1 hypothetical protein PWEIH_04918 [Listeria weihenstephanensis FSL R9-0317]
MNRFFASKWNLILLTVLWSLLFIVNLASYFNTKSELMLLAVGVAGIGLVLNFVVYFLRKRNK